MHKIPEEVINIISNAMVNWKVELAGGVSHSRDENSMWHLLGRLTCNPRQPNMYTGEQKWGLSWCPQLTAHLYGNCNQPMSSQGLASTADVSSCGPCS